MALRKLDLMHRFFGVSDGHTCRECSNFIKGKYHDKVLSVDKGKGIECISVLHTAAERAPAEIRITAQTKLLMICQETGMLGGIGSLPVL